MAFFKVIKIMDDMNLIINCGTDQKIENGDRFHIYSEKTEKITDPYTNEILGEFRKIKAEIEAINVYEKMCICQNAKKTLSFSSSISSLAREKRIPLNVDPSQISGGFNDDEMIQIGDDVEKIN